MASPAAAPKPADHVNPLLPCGSGNPTAAGCTPSVDYVQQDLNTMGKPGQKIMQAREKVLEILQSENACTAWYRTKDADPAATFRTLTFSLNRHGDSYVRRIPEAGGIELIHSPYVASVIQGEGPNATVIINVNGAFFVQVTTLVQDKFDGGPPIFEGWRTIHVGPYAGGSLRAQVLTLLHEFGHAIDLLPADHDDNEGKSRQNTLDVLQACRAEVESKQKPHVLLAAR